MSSRRVSPPPLFDPIYQAGDLLVDAWSWMILRDAIFRGCTRFGEFQERLAISPKVLSARLARLSEGGLFTRRELEGRGAPVEYGLTPMGRDFAWVLLAAKAWGERWSPAAASKALKVTHRSCGAAFRIELCCSACGQVVCSRDVSVVSVHRASSDLIGRVRQRMPDLDAIDRSGDCPIAYTVRAIGDRWSSLVIRECFLGTRRFGDFAEHLGIASNILSSRLERMVSLGLISTAPSSHPRTRHEYRLTEKGHELYGVPLALLTWGERWLDGGGPRTRLRHKPCGRLFRAQHTCAACRAEVTFDDLAFG